MESTDDHVSYYHIEIRTKSQLRKSDWNAVWVNIITTKKKSQPQKQSNAIKFTRKVAPEIVLVSKGKVDKNYRISLSL